MAGHGGNAPGRTRTEVAVVGAGPIGIELAAALRRLDVPYLQFERGPVGKTITRWPRHTRFFSSPERDAVAGIPLQSENQDMVTGERYLSYLRTVVETCGLEIRLFENVRELRKAGDVFLLRSSTLRGEAEYEAKHVVLATGNMEFPRTIGVPGEDLPHVSHYPADPHEYFRRKLLVVGGRNSAVETALRCFRAGSRVTLSYRRQQLDRRHIYSRNFLEIGLLIERGLVRFMPGTMITGITPDEVRFARTDEECRILPGSVAPPFSEPFDAVLLCTGFRSDFSLYEQAGVRFVDGGTVPFFDPETMETNVHGLFVAGTAAGGNASHHGYFIGTCHDHTVKIVKTITGATVDSVGDVSGRRYSITIEDIEPE